MLESVTVTDVGLVVAGLCLLKYALGSKRQGPLPPGPKGWPLIGNLLDMPKEYEWKTFAQWGRQYGDIMSLRIFGDTLVILNSAEQGWRMLDKKSAVYSDRPTLVMCGELVGWDRSLVLGHYGERFRAIRKMMHQQIGTRDLVRVLYPSEQLENHRLLRRIYERPEEFQAAVRKTTSRIILQFSHGYHVKEGVDDVVNEVDKAAMEFSELTKPGAYLVDLLPILRYIPSWFPGAGFKREIAHHKKRMVSIVDGPHNRVKKGMANGTAIPCFVATALQEKDITPEHDSRIKWAAFSIYAGGADTTVSSINTFFRAMSLYPQVQAKAQAEIDAVVGPNRLPSYEDMDEMPYLGALVKEVFRWNQVAPMGVPHRLMEDDMHDGFFIPKGTSVIANIWGMLHDPRLYADPMSFRPDRFVRTPTHEPEQDPRAIVFGFGRRLCPGQHVAEASVWLAAAMVLAVFDVRQTPGEVVPEDVMVSATLSRPKPFACEIRPRSAKAEELIMSVDLSDD